MNPMCGPCGDGICEWMGCALPGLCVCTEPHSLDDDEDE